MKTTDVFFKDTNFVGRELENVQDLVKALSAGMDIANTDGCGYCTYGEKEVEDEDGNTQFEEYEKSEQELFNEMKSDIDGGNKLYAGFFLYLEDYQIYPTAATTLQSNFYVGQEVYRMDNNKITKDEILYINLVKGKKGIEKKYILMGAQGRYTDEKYIFKTKEELVKSLMEG